MIDTGAQVSLISLGLIAALGLLNVLGVLLTAPQLKVHLIIEQPIYIPLLMNTIYLERQGDNLP